MIKHFFINPQAIATKAFAFQPDDPVQR